MGVRAETAKIDVNIVDKHGIEHARRIQGVKSRARRRIKIRGQRICLRKGSRRAGGGVYVGEAEGCRPKVRSLRIGGAVVNRYVCTGDKIENASHDLLP